VLKWKILGLTAAILILTIVGTLFWINSVAERRMARMEAQVKALHDETLARDTSRPPRGEALPGNAWDDYEKAFADLDTNKKGVRHLDEFVGRDPKADRAKTLTVIAAHAAALDHLRRGVRRERAEYPYQWEQGGSMKLPSLLTSQRLANLAAARSRFLVEEGHAREAVELLLDTCQFARDEGANAPLVSEMIALAIYGIAFEELRDIFLSGKLSREDLLAVDRGLEAADRSFPKAGHSLLNESLSIGYALLQPAGVASIRNFALEGELKGSLSLWRYGFSDRLVAADAFDQSLAAMRRLATLEDKPWTEAKKVAGELNQEVQGCVNPILKITMSGLSGGSLPRERKAQLRILRTAVRYRATGELLDLEDPFATKLSHAEKDVTLKLWSVGKDGNDDGGSGEWKPQGKDIVLEIPR
jgi:hypothetical protein